MPKRHHEDSEEERWQRKKRKYERKLEKSRRKRQKRRRIIISSDEEEAKNEEHSQTEDKRTERPIPPIASENSSENPQDPPNDNSGGAVGGAECHLENTNEIVDDFDPNLLQELVETDCDLIEYGDDLQADIAASFQKILQNGLKKELKDELLKKYPFPKNVPMAKGPTLNPEISAMLVETCKQRDKRLLAKQDQLGKGLAALGKALSVLLKKSPDIPEVIRTLNDAEKLLADSHYAETDTRRSVIIPLIDKSLSDPFKDRKRDSFLFGEKLGDLVKDSRGIKKTGQLIQAPASNSSNLNGRGSSFRAARQQRSSQAYLPRTGGPKTPSFQFQYQYPSRRRTAAPPPQRPPPAPRQSAPPPPPRRRSPPSTQQRRR